MTTEEARKFVDDLVRNSQKPISESQNSPNPSGKDTPRTISIDDEEEVNSSQPVNDVDSLKSKVQALQDELKRLQK